LIWLAETTVHTSGINWESVVTIVVGIVTTLSIVGGLFFRYLGKLIANSITAAIDKFRIDVVYALDVRLARVETKVDNVREKQNQFSETIGNKDGKDDT
jgi:hypothetical protein